MEEEINSLDDYVEHLLRVETDSDSSIYYYKGDNLDKWSDFVTNKDEIGFIYKGYVFIQI